MARIILEKSTISDPHAEIADLQKFVSANPALVQTLFDATETEVSSIQADGATTGTTNFTSALSDFVTDAVAVGDYVTVSKALPANIGRWRVTAITDLNTLVLDSALSSDSSISFTVNRGKSYYGANDQFIVFED